MSKIFDLNKQLNDLNNRAYFLDADDPEDALELEEINKSLTVLAEHAENIADWFVVMINEALFAESNADILARKFAKKKRTASARIGFFKEMALDFMIKHNIKETCGEMFSISRSLTPGVLMYDVNFDPELLPPEFVEIVPAVPEHKKVIGTVVSAALRNIIKDDKGKLDQINKIVTSQGLPGITLVRNETLKIK